MDPIDVAFIGGRPAGLTAASTLAHKLHAAVVFGLKIHRNALATRMHMVVFLVHNSQIIIQGPFVP